MKLALTLSVLCLASACKTTTAANQGTSTAKNVPADTDTQLNEDLAFIKTDAAKMVAAKREELGAPANRDFHSKGMCFKGTLTVDAEGVPEDYRVGLFAQDGRYPLYGRFSNGRPGRDSNDRDISVFGFGIKVIGVPGDKFDMQSLGSTKPRNHNQDWNLATGQTFPIPTAAIYREQRAASGNAAATTAFAIKHPTVAQALFASLKRIDTYLVASYHSQTALHYGEDYVAKFSAMPCDHVERDITAAEAATRTPNHLAESLATKMAASGACFILRAQIRPADDKLSPETASWAQKYPANDPTKLWAEADIPFVNVGKIEFRPHQVQTAALVDNCEALSINPGNALQAFRPIESDTLMRSRFLSAYEGSVSKRTELNVTAQAEPAAIPPAQIDGWLND